MHDLVEADLWSQLPVDLPALLALLPRADLYLQDEMQVAFHPTLTRVWCRKGRRGQRLVEAPGDNRRVYGFGLVDWRDGWFDGRVAPGRTADVFCEQVRAAVARSKERGRVAIVMTDNLKTHTSAGSLLVRRMLTEFQEHLYLVYTPAYDPDANRIEWLWRASRRIVTHNHHRSTFEGLLADVEQHFQALARTPAEILRYIGSPFAPDKDHDTPLSLAQAVLFSVISTAVSFTSCRSNHSVLREECFWLKMSWKRFVEERRRGNGVHCTLLVRGTLPARAGFSSVRATEIRTTSALAWQRGEEGVLLPLSPTGCLAEKCDMSAWTDVHLSALPVASV